MTFRLPVKVQPFGRLRVPGEVEGMQDQNPEEDRGRATGGIEDFRRVIKSIIVALGRPCLSAA